MELKKIILTLEGENWFADFHKDQQIEELFGSTKILTPFTGLTPAAVVLACVQGRNPNCSVELGR